MNTAPYDLSLSLLLNQSQRLALVQGEDRSILMQVLDAGAQRPLDLTGWSLAFGMPRQGGGVLRRSSQAVLVQCAASVVLNGQSVFTLPAHGLADGETVELAPIDGGSLPAPLEASMPYRVLYLTPDTFALSQLGSGMVALASNSGFFELGGQLITITNAPLGEAQLLLSQRLTAQAATGQGQSYQLTLTDADGKVRVIIGKDQLDVSVQPCP